MQKPPPWGVGRERLGLEVRALKGLPLTKERQLPAYHYALT